MFITPEVTEKEEVEVLGQSEALVEHYMKYAAANSKVNPKPPTITTRSLAMPTILEM